MVRLVPLDVKCVGPAGLNRANDPKTQRGSGTAEVVVASLVVKRNLYGGTDVAWRAVSANSTLDVPQLGCWRTLGVEKASPELRTYVDCARRVTPTTNGFGILNENRE